MSTTGGRSAKVTEPAHPSHNSDAHRHTVDLGTGLVETVDQFASDEIFEHP
jgi:hypothetical protein